MIATGFPRDLAFVETEVRRITQPMAADPAVLAIYSDGSFARTDLVYGSDIDIGIVIDAETVPDSRVRRIVIDEVLFEHCTLPKSYYTNRTDILSDAGFAFDVANAHIWFERDRFFSRIQEDIRKGIVDQGFRKVRVANQLKAAEQNLSAFMETAAGADLEPAVQPLVGFLRHAFAVPTALLNRPVTNTRAYLYSRRDFAELGLDGYEDAVLKALVPSAVSQEGAKRAMESALAFIMQSGLPPDEIKGYRAHLGILDYYYALGDFAGSMWPLFFWTMAIIRDVKRWRGDSVDVLFEQSRGFRSHFDLVMTDECRARTGHMQEVLARLERLAADSV